MGDNSQQFSWFSATWIATYTILQSNLSGPDFKLLFFILNQMNRGNSIKLKNYKEIASTLSLGERTVSQSVKRLKDLDIITKTPRPKTFMVNPFFFYTGGKQGQIELKIKYQTYKQEVLSKKQETQTQSNLDNSIL